MRIRSTILPSLYAAAAALMLHIPTASANMAMLTPLLTRLDILLDTHRINKYQHGHIVLDLVANEELLTVSMKDHDDHVTRPSLSEEQVIVFNKWIDRELAEGRLKEDTADLIINLFDLFLPAFTNEVNARSIPNGPAPASTENVVSFVGNLNFAPNSGIYNGIWGYRNGDREYALQCNGVGLNILDVTTETIFKVQTIVMPGGSIWRDVATHDHYAYVAAQNGGNAWVIDLVGLSPNLSAPNGEDSNPIFTEEIKDIGYTNWGHTMNVDKGLLFLNSAGGGNGCKILDLLSDPMSPKVLVDKTTSYGGGDCHDSYVQTIGNKDILISSDGYDKKWTFFDITDIRTASPPITKMGGTSTADGRVYAHEGVLSEDGNTLFAFDEFNNFDIAAYDIQNLADPRLIREFQWSEEDTSNSIVHNGFVRGNQLIVGYYEAGLRVFDISDINNGVTEVGNLETYRDPNNDGIFDKQIGGGYNGVWNVYVGLPSGKVLLSDTISGTFVVNIQPNPGPVSPTQAPEVPPTQTPVVSPTQAPEVPPTETPVVSPTETPVVSPTETPVVSPTQTPVVSPIQAPEVAPTRAPEVSPTQAPVFTESFSPTPTGSDSCSDSTSDRFLLKSRNRGGSVQYTSKSCNWLRKLKKADKRIRICSRKTKCHEDYGSAEDTCPETCNTCEPCDQNSDSRFYYKTNKRDKVISKSCSWLDDRLDDQREKACQTSVPPGVCYGSAMEVCPISCPTIACATGGGNLY